MKTDICGIQYSVNYLEPNSREDTFMGRTDPQMASITINKNMPKDIQEQCLIHEWLHAVLCNYAMEQTNDEQMVQALASELFRSGFKVTLNE